MAHIIKLTDFNTEGYENFIEDINNSEHIEDREIYLASEGGSTWTIEPFKKIIEDRQIPIITHSDLFSSALILVLITNTKITILKHTRAIFHYPYQTHIELNPDSSLRLQGKTNKKLQKDTFVDITQLKKILKINKKQHKKLMKGSNILYNYKQLRKILNKN